MIRLLIVVVIIALVLTKVSDMLYEKEAERGPEDTMIGEAYEPYLKAQKFGEEDYEEALDAQREELDKQIDGG